MFHVKHIVSFFTKIERHFLNNFFSLKNMKQFTNVSRETLDDYITTVLSIHKF